MKDAKLYAWMPLWMDATFHSLHCHSMFYEGIQDLYIPPDKILGSCHTSSAVFPVINLVELLVRAVLMVSKKDLLLRMFAGEPEMVHLRNSLQSLFTGHILKISTPVIHGYNHVSTLRAHQLCDIRFGRLMHHLHNIIKTAHLTPFEVTFEQTKAPVR